MKELYLDNSATTPICEEALARYIEVSRGAWGNPSSRHGRGKEAEDVLTDARRAVREALGARDGQVVFTSGGTEANNLAITGRLLAKPRYKRMGKLLTTEGEHASVSAPLEALRAEGVRVVEIPTRGGEIDLARLAEEMTPDVVLVSMMLVNNESGALYDIAAVSRLMRAKSPDAVLHVDATQGFL
ncbi:MAG: aminotransferase class V-fold PLP-dependent enzyme, partial [Clostridia bacterium]|nr:aminotransferase class V-fold PLP-dependent enzyme [Clostridia bacterium]